MRRPVGRLYAPYVAFSGELGAVTAEQSVVIVAVFSEPVLGLAPSQFAVAGPAGAAVTALKLLHGTASYYHLLLQLPGAYAGQVTLSYVVSIPPGPCAHAAACGYRRPRTW